MGAALTCAEHRAPCPPAVEPARTATGRAPHHDRPPGPARGPVLKEDAMTRQPNLTARSDHRYIRSAHRSERFVLVELDAPPAAQKPARDAVNLAFVLDRSGSMSGLKLELAKRAIETAVDRLLPTDRFAVVCYDDRIDVVVEGTTASREAKTNAIERLRSIDA